MYDVSFMWRCPAPNLVTGEVYEAVEVFAGKGNLSRALLAAGYSTAYLDILDFKPWIDGRAEEMPVCDGNPLDLTTSAGFAWMGPISVRVFSLYTCYTIYCSTL